MFISTPYLLATPLVTNTEEVASERKPEEDAHALRDDGKASFYIRMKNAGMVPKDCADS